MPRHQRPTNNELLGWACFGLGVGAAAGYLLGLKWGRIDLGGIRRLWRSEDAENSGTERRAAALARDAGAALEHDDQLRGLGLQIVAVGPGVIELHGWVASRMLRARATRVAQGVPGVESLVNCILVHGEDDEPKTPRLEIGDQPA